MPKAVKINGTIYIAPSNNYRNQYNGNRNTGQNQYYSTNAVAEEDPTQYEQEEEENWIWDLDEESDYDQTETYEEESHQGEQEEQSEN